MGGYRQDVKRKFDSFSDEDTAIQAANTKARQLSTLSVKASQLSDDDLRACVAAMEQAKPLGLTVTEIVSRYAEASRIAGDVLTTPQIMRETPTSSM